MTSISRREKELLGYEPDSLSSCSGDVDFSDVFGGPPRRFSIQESRNGSSDSGDGGEFRRSLLLGFGEKPVFGNEMGSRRKYQNDDFFDDIFRGDQSSPSCSQSPRVVNARDSFSSAPGSRVMSPSRPLPPSAEPLIPPAKFSLPVKLTSTEFAASPSATQSWNSPSSYPSRLNQTTQTQNFDSYRPSPLSHQTSMDAKQSPKLPKLHHKSGIAKESKRSSVPIPIDCNQFHFSIYKWPNKSVPLLMPVRKIDRFLSSNERAGRDIKHNHGSLSFNIRNNDTISSSKSADSHCFDHEEIAQELPESVSSSSSLQQVQDNVDLHGLEDVRESVSFTVKDSFLQEQSKADDSKSPEKKKKFDLRSFLHEERKGDEIPIVENGGKERKVKEKEKPSLDDFVPSRKINKVKAESFRETKDEPQKDEGIGGSKVKDFVNIFNQESSSKATENDRRQSQSFRWKDTNYSFEVDSEVKFTTTSHEEVEATSINWENSPTKDLEMANGDSFLFGKQQFDVKSSSRVSATPIPALPKEPNHTNGVRDSAPNIKTIQDVILNQNMIEDVSLPIEVQKKDEMKIYENKIRQWSKGKEGNIRALLSTLQNVLWPNSGWKAVPLVDIIEANAVKRAYQKALLRLHPDKLQQKGAPSHQKFIAEKVFDVLQEAWDHFNSLGSF